MRKMNIFILAIFISNIFATTSFAKTLLLSYDGSVHKYTGAICDLKVNGDFISTDIPPVILNNSSLVPVRAVFEKLGAVVNWDAANKRVLISMSDKNVELKINDKNAVVNNDVVQMSVPAKIINNKTMVPLRFVGEQLNAQVDWLPSENLISINKNMSSGKFRGINVSPKGNNDEVNINIDSYTNYKVTRVTSPDRIVLDIPFKEKPSGQKKIDVNSGLLKSIRYSQYDKNSLRVVLDVIGQPQFNAVEKSGQLTLNVENPAYRNIKYDSNGDRICLRLIGAKLTEDDENLKKLYTDKYELNGNRYTMTFPSKLADLGDGTIKINDSFINSIQIVNDKVSQKTSIIFDAKSKFFYETITRPSAADTAITIFKPALDTDKLVVIDAGHGGSETGAIFGELLEKNINLDIAQRLNKQLESKNIKTYMIRDDDSFVGLFERAYIANDLNAVLFISVHNNAIGDPDYGGTMTLYFPQSPNDKDFNSKRFAQIIQDKLLATLKTTDRKIIERPNLVVLKGTVMPSALAEVAFMTNKPDRENLKKDDFKTKAAIAISQAVFQALNEMK